MDLHEIAAKICTQMGAISAKEIKCGIRFNTTTCKEQYITFSVFWVLDNKSREEIKNIDFYEFHTDQQRAEKLERIERLLSGDMTVLYNTSNFN
jgi:hypothetical protein